jgi:hypothetical protein
VRRYFVKALSCRIPHRNYKRCLFESVFETTHASFQRTTTYLHQHDGKHQAYTEIVSMCVFDRKNRKAQQHKGATRNSNDVYVRRVVDQLLKVYIATLLVIESSELSRQGYTHDPDRQNSVLGTANNNLLHQEASGRKLVHLHLGNSQYLLHRSTEIWPNTHHLHPPDSRSWGRMVKDMI